MTIRRLAIALSLLIAIGTSATPQDKKYEMTQVKYAGLKDEILKHRGKVVVLDFWAGY
jgi:hypothetical protein